MGAEAPRLGQALFSRSIIGRVNLWPSGINEARLPKIIVNDRQCKKLTLSLYVRYLKYFI